MLDFNLSALWITANCDLNKEDKGTEYAISRCSAFESTVTSDNSEHKRFEHSKATSWLQAMLPDSLTLTSHKPKKQFGKWFMVQLFAFGLI